MVWWLAVAWAATVGQIPVQGELIGPTGLPLDGTHEVTFRVWTGGATAAWTEAIPVAVSGGRFSALLGSTASLDVETLGVTGTLALTVQIGDGLESPPVPIAWVPRAAYAANAGALGGAPASDWARKADLAAGAGLALTGTSYGVALANGSGLTLAGGRLGIDFGAFDSLESLASSCAAGQVPKFQSGGGWACAADNAGASTASFLGQTRANPGTSCKNILDVTEAAANGLYWIQPSGVAQPFRAWCNMTDAGGGWTLVLRLGVNSSEFHQGGAAWESATLINDGDYDFQAKTNSKYAAYTSVPFTQVYFRLGGPTGATSYQTGFTINTGATSMLAAQQRAWGAVENRSELFKSSDYRTLTGADPTQLSTNGSEVLLMGWSLKQQGHFSDSLSGGRTRVGSILDEGAAATANQTYANGGSAYGLGAAGGNPAKTIASGYCGWTIASCGDAFPAFLYVR